MLGIDFIALAIFLLILSWTFYLSAYKKYWLLLLVFKGVFTFIQTYYYLHITDYIGDIEKFFRATTFCYSYFKIHPEKIVSFYLPFTENIQELSTSHVAKHLSMVKLLLPFYTLSKGSFLLTLAYVTLALTAILYKCVVMALKKFDAPLFIPCLIILPSIAFWTSGIQKEAFLYPLWIYSGAQLVSFLNSKDKKSISLLLLLATLLVTVLITYLLKFYYLLPLAALVGIVLLEYKVQNIRTYSILLSLVILLLAFLTSIHPYISIFNFNEIIAANYFNFCSNQNSSCISLPIDGTTWGVLRAVPSALIKGILGPLPWEWKNALYVLQSLEHIIAIVMLVWMLVKYGLKKSFLKSFYLIVIWCMVMAILHVLTAPNYGSLSRYESIYFPLLIFICFNQIEYKFQIPLQNKQE